MKILIACEFSQVVCKAFREKGHEAYSCDILPCEGGHPEWHIQDDILNHLDENWDMMIAHPPCTYLTVTANKWLKDQPKRKSGALVGEERRKAQHEAINFFRSLYFANIPKIAIENPVNIMSSNLRKPDQIIQPFQFGHSEPKKTCLWLKGLPKLQPTKIVTPEYILTKSGKRIAKWYYWETTKLPVGPKRSKERSKSFIGIAQAMADQWNF